MISRRNAEGLFTRELVRFLPHISVDCVAFGFHFGNLNRREFRLRELYAALGIDVPRDSWTIRRVISIGYYALVDFRRVRPKIDDISIAGTSRSGCASAAGSTDCLNAGPAALTVRLFFSVRRLPPVVRLLMGRVPKAYLLCERHGCVYMNPCMARRHPEIRIKIHE